GAAGSVPPGAWTIGEAGGGSPLFAPAVDAAPSQVPSEGPAPWTVLDAKGVDGGETISAGPGPWSVQAAPEPGKTQPIEAASASSLPVPEAAEEGWDDVWPDLASPGVLGKLIELVRAQPGYEHVARVLLGDVVVVEDLATARRLWGENGHRKTIVTLAGEVLDPVGVLTGGTAETVSSGMLAQKREINELTEQVRELEVKVRTAEERHAALKYRLAELDLAIKELSRSGHQEDLSIVKLERDLKRLEEGVARHEQERATYEEELAMIADQRAAIAAELEQTKVSIRELEERRDAAEVSVAAKSMEVNSLREAYRTLAEQVTELKVTVAANAERREGSLRNLTRIVARIADVETRLARLADVQKECEIESERLLDKIEQSKVEAVALAEKIDREKAELTVESEGLEAEAKQLRDEESDFRSRRKVIDTLKEQLGAAQIKMRECQLGRESLLQQVDERYRINLADVLQDYHLVPPQTDDDRAEMEKLRNQIDHIGPINLTAIEEFNQVNERYTFLSAQKEDLEQAIAALRAAIRRINSTSKERYMEAFRLVNEKFQLVFPRLFNGGSASLVMLDESDPLESGIEMLAQPPGKKLQSVNLLSGGEKALTAVSLIFSIFLIKPTPFCLLDEVDAPLDEANVGRYNDMVKDMSKVSQFILITHNKRTMELPDRLYGVTMEEPGISKIVPVDVKGERSKSSQSLRAV
ncbi:hypothetical protein L6R52_41735, partial [Myxococcota bacterium]|nr:hypothetical protein [Myxococcota bacterium]